MIRRSFLAAFGALLACPKGLLGRGAAPVSAPAAFDESEIAVRASEEDGLRVEVWNDDCGLVP